MKSRIITAAIAAGSLALIAVGGMAPFCWP